MMFIFITWSRTFIIVLNKNSENGHLCPLLDLRRKASNILQYNISCKDFGGIDICCQLEIFFFLVCWDFFFFYHVQLLNFITIYWLLLRWSYISPLCLSVLSITETYAKISDDYEFVHFFFVPTYFFASFLLKQSY